MTRTTFNRSGKPPGPSPSLLAAALLCVAGLAAPNGVAATIQMPDDAYGSAGGTVSIPIAALPADGILGADIQFLYNPAVLAPTGATPTAISTGFSVTRNFTVAGRVILSLFGTSAMVGSGPIVHVHFNIIGAPGATSTLDLTLASLNEGKIPSVLDDGLFTVCTAVDTDGDTILDCADPDDDGDGVADALDCAPLDPTASALPPEVLAVTFAAGPSRAMQWASQGAGVRYDVAGAPLAALVGPGASSAACIDNDVATASWSDPRPSPAAGAGVYYIVRGQNVCGGGTYGTASSGVHRSPSADCP